MDEPAPPCGAGKFMPTEGAMAKSLSLASRVAGTGNRRIAVSLLRAVAAASALLTPAHAAFAADSGVMALTQLPQVAAQSAQSADALPVPAFAPAGPSTPSASAVADDIKVVAALNASSSRPDPVREHAVTAKFEQVTMFAAQCGLTLPLQGRASSLSCPFEDSDLGLKLATKFGQTQAYTSFAFGTTSPWTPQRQLTPYRAGLREQNSAALLGLSQGLFDNRLWLTAELALTDSRERMLFDSPLQPRSGRSLAGSSRLVRAEAKLLDAPRIKWTLKAEYSQVSDNFAMNQATMVLGQSIALPGRRIALSNTLKLGPTRFVASYDDYRSFFGTGVARRLGMNSNGVSLTVKSNSFEYQPTRGGPFEMPVSKSGQTQVSLDFDIASLSPGLAAPFKALGPLAPQSLSLNWRKGWSETVYAGIADRYGRSGWDASATWETPIGETTLDYSLDRRRNVASPGIVKTSKTFQLSHMIRWNGWRLGADAMLSKYSASGARGLNENGWSIGQTLAYSRANGPEFRMRIGQDRDRMQSNGDLYSSNTSGLNVTATLDLTRYLRKRFERDDLHLKLEFRKRMDSSDETYALLEDIFERKFERSNRSVFLLSAGMKF